jgi:hypothetical protein
MAVVKELHFFDDETADWSRPDYTRLHAGFDWGSADVVRGEATPIYTYWPNALHRLKQYNRTAKIIVGLRHPSFRAYSHWRMESSRGVEPLSFSAAIRSAGRTRPADVAERAHRDFTYVERGFYSSQVDRLLRLFDRDQIFLFRTDRLWSEPGSILDAVAAFLGIDREIRCEPAYIVSEFGRPADAMGREDRAHLDDVFSADIRMTADLTGLDLDDWLDSGYVEPMRPDWRGAGGIASTAMPRSEPDRFSGS